jgi:hypothetical protein
MRQLERYCDLATLTIGAFLFMSPWVLGFGAPKPNLPTQIVSVLGAVIGVTGIAAVIAFEIWELYIVIAFAIASIASPWLFGVTEHSAFLVLILTGLSALATSGAHILIIRRTRATTDQVDSRLKPFGERHRTSRGRSARESSARRRAILNPELSSGTK